MRVAHAQEMPGTFSPLPNSKETASSRSRHASRHARHARAVMHVEIANPRWWENVPGIPGAYAICNFTYLARAPYPCVRHQLPNISLFVDNSARTWYRHISLCRTKYSYCKCGVEWWYKTTDKNNDYHNPYINVCTVSNVDRARNFSIYPEIFHNQRDQTWAGFKYDGVEQSGARSLDLHMTSKTKLYLS